jgi:hypothetical protein
MYLLSDGSDDYISTPNLDTWSCCPNEAPEVSCLEMTVAEPPCTLLPGGLAKCCTFGVFRYFRSIK